VRQPDEQRKPDRVTAPDARLDAVLLAACVLLPACLASAHVANMADAAHDEAVVRAVGLGWTGAWRALDAPWCALFSWVPLGTRATRAALATAMACGAGGAVVFVLARAMALRMVETARMGLVVAAIASLATTLSPAWQLEAMAPAGGCLGAALGLAPLALVAAWRAEGAPRHAMAALLAGMAVSYEPLVGLAAIASLAAWWGAHGGGREASAPTGTQEIARAAGAFVVGCAPFGIALARRGSPLSTAASAFAQFAGERGASPAGMPAALARDDLGILSCVAVVVGMGLACVVPRARALALSLAAIVAVAIVAMASGAPAGPSRYGAAVLAGVAAAYAIAAVAMQALVRVVDEARVPFAHASAAMILVLEMALPARAADDASVRAELRAPAVTRQWDDAAFASLPAGAVVIVASPPVETRLLSARAAGEMRADVAVVPLFDLASRGAMRELARDPKLESLWHDAALVGPPQEWSLSSLASWRPLVAPYDSTWDRALARHFIPLGLFARFEPEPRGATDRKRALDDFLPARDPLARALEGDIELRGLTARLLRERVITFAATNEREVVARALEDLRAFSPRDPVAIEIVRRSNATKGAIDVRDLSASP
jgi:hypothetical protein